MALLTDSELVYRVSQVFAAFASTVGADAKVFRDVQKAREWLSESSSKPASS